MHLFMAMALLAWFASNAASQAVVVKPVANMYAQPNYSRKTWSMPPCTPYLPKKPREPHRAALQKQGQVHDS